MKKKSFYILALAALAVSCTNDELTTNETNAVVGFHALTSGVTTRAVNETNSVNLKDSPFDVYAFTETDGKLFIGKSLSESDYELSQGVEIRHNGSAWDYANPADIIRKSKFPQNPKRSVRFSGKRTKRSVQKRKARNTQKAETKVL